MNRQRDDHDAETSRSLRACVLFRDCSDDDPAAILPRMAERVYAAGAVIVAEGEPASELFVVRSGEVEVTKHPQGGGQEYRLTTLGAGASFGELTVVDRGARSASVRALVPTTVAVLPMAALD